MTDNVQFFHNVQNKYTVAVDVPTKEELMYYMETIIKGEADGVVMLVGITKCHPKEQYVRKLGREYAKSKMTGYIMEYTGTYKDMLTNKLVTSFIHKSENLNFSLTFETSKNSDKVYFVEAY